MSIYKTVQLVIRERSVTQKLVANAIGMKETTLSAKLHGHRKLYADEFGMICRALGVSADSIIDRRNTEQAGDAPAVL